MTTIFYILIAFCLFFEVLNLAACKKVFAAVEKYKDKNDQCKKTYPLRAYKTYEAQ